MDRVQAFLYDTELLDEFRDKTENDEVVDQIIAEGSATALGFRDATFTWSDAPIQSIGSTPSRKAFVLQIDAELLFKVGEFNMILGPTSSGSCKRVLLHRLRLILYCRQDCTPYGTFRYVLLMLSSKPQTKPWMHKRRNAFHTQQS